MKSCSLGDWSPRCWTPCCDWVDSVTRVTKYTKVTMDTKVTKVTKVTEDTKDTKETPLLNTLLLLDIISLLHLLMRFTLLHKQSIQIFIQYIFIINRIQSEVDKLTKGS